MKKLIAVVGLVLVAGVINIQAQSSSYTLNFPTNIPSALVQSMVARNTVQLAQAQIQAASIAQLETLTPSVGVAVTNAQTWIATAPTNIPVNTNMVVASAARQAALTYLKQQTNVDMLNSNIVAKLPVPPSRPAYTPPTH